MAVILTMNYSKKLGLPNFSSHQCSVSLQTEIADLSQVTGEVKRLYALTQDAVDREIQEVGYLPDATSYGMHPVSDGPNGNARDTGADRGGRFSAEHRNGNGAWNCSDRQRELVEKIVNENNLEKHQVENLAQEVGVGRTSLYRLFHSTFGVPVATFFRVQRLEEAKRQLADPDRSVAGIAESLGMKNPSYFSRWFRTETGLSPTEYRQAGGKMSIHTPV